MSERESTTEKRKGKERTEKEARRKERDSELIRLFLIVES